MDVGGGEQPGRWDFFVSYTQADRAWAEWIAWQLEEDKHRVLIQDWDFVPGSHWVQDMQEGVQQASHTIAVLSVDYLSSVYASAEWQAAWARDPSGKSRKLLTVRVSDCERPGLLDQVVSVDLFGIDEHAARHQLRRMVSTAIAGRAKPDKPPSFPGRAIFKEPGFPGDLPEVWRVPPRNPNFTDREPVLERVASELTSGPVVVTLHGMGGVGKSQLAAEYAYAHATDYDVVWWIAAYEPALLAGQFAALAEQLVPVPITDRPQALRGQVYDALRSKAGWLLIFDNADTLDGIREWLPAGPLRPGSRGHVLVTTQRSGFAALGRVVDLDVLGVDDAVRLLRTRVSNLTLEVSEQIAEELGRLPLALEQAAAYMDETGIPGEQYLDLFRRRAAEMYGRGKVIGRDETIATLWDLSLGRISGQHPAAVQLLDVCAYLAPEPVPLDLFTSHYKLLPEPLSPAAADPLVFGETVGVLVDYSLARRTAAALKLHRLVQGAIRFRLPIAQAATFRAHTEAILAASNPGRPEDPVTWKLWANLLPHLLAANLEDTDNEDLRATAGDACWYLLASGNARNAHALAADLHRRWRERFGDDDPDTLMAANYLGWALEGLGNGTAARDMYRDTFERRRRVLGADDSDTLTSASNLTALLGALGDPEGGLSDLQEAQELGADTLARCRRVLGADHHKTLASAGNRAIILAETGDLQAALKLGTDTLARCRRVLGENHPDTLIAATNLAHMHFLGGDRAAARKLSEETLDRWRDRLGKDHPSTLTCADELGDILRAQGEYAAARALDEDTLDRRRRILGEDHPDTLTSGIHLGEDLRGHGESPADG